jgi:hypothetical protein
MADPEYAVAWRNESKLINYLLRHLLLQCSKEPREFLLWRGVSKFLNYEKAYFSI